MKHPTQDANPNSATENNNWLCESQLQGTKAVTPGGITSGKSPGSHTHLPVLKWEHEGFQGSTRLPEPLVTGGVEQNLVLR